ncbi:MAG: signal recognition particle-docking protein FtsY [Firmicutes bacterium]|nr:signal recognition particle-docking protein FtsY [Clostridiales bacterium]MBQ4339735.1 signal recognition particle-docking protein FtsY [Bacillota bacterium]
MSFFKKLSEGLKRTKENMVAAFEDAFNTYTKVDDQFLEELEDILIMSDVGMDTAMKISDRLKESVKKNKIDDVESVKKEVKSITADILNKGEDAHKLSQEYPLVVMVIGVNGVGKTTSIAKIANGLKKEGKSVQLVAADTFRAAAAEQLQVWGERIGVNVIKHKEGSDPAAVIFDGVQSAKARGTDVIICDTAGRLHNKKNLMTELNKMNKIIDREFPEAHKETLLVIDGATGQNGKSQVKEFKEIADITGIVLTKLDGTAKGGIVISISDEFDIPVKYIGVGEGVEDMQPFEPAAFADALFDGRESW